MLYDRMRASAKLTLHGADAGQKVFIGKRSVAGNGLSMVAVPFRLLNATDIVAMYAPRVIPPDVLDNHFHYGLILCSNEAIADPTRAGTYVRTIAVATSEEAERFVEQTS